MKNNGWFTLVMAFAALALLVLLGYSEATAASPGYAIVVPSNYSFEGPLSYAKSGNRVKGALARRGITDITSISSGKSALQNAIQVWARDRMNADPAPLYIVMIDHGGLDYFHLGEEILSSAELALWLETLEAGLTPAAKLQQRVIVLGFCFSGSFIDDLSRSGRVVITSSAPGEESYKGPMEPDGIRGGEYFIDQLFAEFGRGMSLKQAFVAATASVRGYLPDPAITSISQYAPFYLDGARQHPLLDDDGDGIGSNSLSDESGDGLVAIDLFLGTLPPCDQTPSGCPAVISTMPDSLFMDETATSALVWAKSSDISRTKWILSDGTGMTFNAQSGAWEKTETISPGKNVQAHHLIENDAYLSISPLRTSVVYRGKAGNSPPAPFALTEPLSGSLRPGVLVFRWNDSADPDGDAVSYTLLVSRTSDFSSIEVRKENLPYPAVGLGSDAGLQAGVTYYWKVQAIDAYGLITESSNTGSVTIDNSGGIPTLIEGHALSLYSGLPVSGAAVWSVSGGSATSLANGYFVLATMPGSAEVTVSAPGYVSATKTLSVQQGSGAHLMFPLEPTPRPTLTVKVTGPGYGTVESIPAGISCSSGSTCSGTATAPSMKLVVSSTTPHTAFSHWVGEYCYVGDCTIRMTADKTVTAVFGAAPGAVTTAASSFEDTWATFSGTVNPNELATEARFAYRQLPGGTWQYTNWISNANGSSSGSWIQYSSKESDLLQLTTYEYRIEARNAEGTTLGGSMTVTLKGSPPAVSTGQISGLTSTAVTLSGTVTPHGSNTDHWFEYGTTDSFGSSTPHLSAGSDPTANVSVTAALSGLLPRTTYYYRIVASNQYGTTYGSAGTFYTPYAGTLTGYGMVKDIYAGATSSSPTSLAVLNDTLYFSANSLLHGRELWRSDGSIDGTFLVKEITPGEGEFDPTGFALVNGNLYFTGTWPTAIYKTDGTSTGTVSVFNSSRLVYRMVASANKLYFWEQDINIVNKLWATNGTTTSLVKDGLYVTGMSPWDKGIFMNVQTVAEGTELWKSDGTATGTVLIKDINPGSASSSPSSPIKVGDTWLFTANDGVHGNEVWRTDGTTGGTVMVKDICPGACNSTYSITAVMNGVAYFTATDGVSGSELWRSDGTEAGTYLVKDINPGANGSAPSELTVVNNLLFFRAYVNNTGHGLWVSDGSATGTMVIRSNFVLDSNYQGYPTRLSGAYGKLYFRANETTSGSELWVSDSTPNGTYMLYDINAGSGSSNPDQFTPVAGNLFFTATTPATGTELYFLALTTYTVTPVAGPNGSINPGAGQVLSDGAIGRFLITPDPGYHIASVTGCGGTLSGNLYITGRITEACTVNATFEPDSFLVTPAAGANGTLEPPVPQTVSRGNSTSFTVTPNTGYHIESVTGCGGTLNGTTYTTGPVSSDCTVAATFAVNTYTATIFAGANGTLEGPVNITHGDKPTYVITPTAGYHVADVLVNGTSVGAVTSYAFPSGVSSDITISASFAINTYTITATAGANGSIAGPTTVPYGDRPTYTITSSTGYHVADVLVDGTSVGAVTTYTLPNVTANHVITASFAINTYTITATAGANGSITGPATINHGTSANYTISAATGYQVANVQVDGISVGAVTSYTITNVTAPHTITAAFVPELALATAALPGGTVGAPYSQSLAASGGVGPYTWGLAGGSLPAGLSLNSAGVISGTPVIVATSTFTVMVTDSTSRTVTRTFSIAIAAAAGKADLIVTNVNASNAVITRGKTKYTFSATVRNQGTVSTKASTLSFYFSTDSAVTSSDILIGDVSVGALDPGASRTVTLSVAVPASVPANSYYLGAIADRKTAIPEASEINNSLSSPTTYTVR